MSSKETEVKSGSGYFSRPVSNVYEFYLSGSITEPENYVEWFDIIRNAGPNDVIKIYINSGGGMIDTALQFIRVMNETEAQIICSVEGSCMSAATMIFLNGHVLEVTPHSLFMFHNYSGGTFGKGGEMMDQLAFEREWSTRFLKEIYYGFFNDSEIDSMLHNKDIWMHSDEVLERAKKAMALRAKRDENEDDPKPV